VNQSCSEDAGGLDDHVLRSRRSPEYRTPEHGRREQGLAVDQVYDEEPTARRPRDVPAKSPRADAIQIPWRTIIVGPSAC